MRTYHDSRLIYDCEKAMVPRDWKYPIKIICSWLLTFRYSMLLRSCRPVKRELKYRLVVGAIFKNEAPFLREWIEYHLLAGVEHFYLYNNFSDDGYSDILREYVASGIVDLIDWPVPQGQPSAYEDCFARCRNEGQWVAFIDIDEFIVPKYETNIADWLENYRRFSSVALYWRVFGTSGILSQPTGSLVTEQFTVCWDKLDSISKVVFNTDYEIADFGNLHQMSARIGRSIVPPVNEFGKYILFGIHRLGKSKSESTIQINHYWSKSYLYYVREKVSRGDAYFTLSPRNLEYFNFHEMKNIATDHTIWRYLIALKARMGMIPNE
jgi:Glycosyltransferase family 92